MDFVKTDLANYGVPEKKPTNYTSFEIAPDVRASYAIAIVATVIVVAIAVILWSIQAILGGA